MVIPSWFKQRQGKAEPAGENTYRLTGPNLEEAFLVIRKSDKGGWSCAVRRSADGADLETGHPDFDTPRDAWDAAFELYRRRFVV
jgi:hypothetical protein